MAHGEITHVEFPADDVERAKHFYGELFGWTFNAMEGLDDYFLFQTAESGGPSGGAIGKRHVNTTDSPCVYVTVDSIDLTIPKAVGMGATLGTPKTPIPGFGWYAILNDTEGNLLGLYETASR